MNNKSLYYYLVDSSFKNLLIIKSSFQPEKWATKDNNKFSDS